MDWRPYPTRWRSLYWDYEAPGEELPLDFVTPDEAWDYGAITQSLEPAAGDLILRVRARSERGRIGISVAKTNGSAILSREALLTPEDGERIFYFRLSPDQTSASLLVRNYDDDGVFGAVRIEEVTALGPDEADQAVLDQVAPPYVEG